MKLSNVIGNNCSPLHFSCGTSLLNANQHKPCSYKDMHLQQK